MMWAGAKDHVAGARAQARQRTLPPWDAICPRCYPLWRCHPFGCHQQPSDATPTEHHLPYMPPPLKVPLSLNATNSHQIATSMGHDLPQMLPPLEVLSPLEVSPPLDATPSPWMPFPWDIGPMGIPTLPNLSLHAGACPVQAWGAGAGGSPQGPPPSRAGAQQGPVQVSSGKEHAGFQAGLGRAPAASCRSQPGCQVPANLPDLPPPSPTGSWQCPHGCPQGPFPSWAPW